MNVSPRSTVAQPVCAVPAWMVYLFGMTLSLALLWNLPASAEELRIKQYYKGLPDPVQVLSLSGEAADFTALQTALKGAIRSTKDGRGKVSGLTELSGTGVRKALAKLAPKLPLSGDQVKLLVLNNALRGKGEPDLYIAYNYLLADDPATPQQGDHYFYLWRLKWSGSDYQGSLFGPSLEGRILSVRPFAIHKRPTFFVHTVSCTECEAWQYLLAVDLTEGGELYRFTYAANHASGWKPVIEYGFPGQGHSADVAVETRLPEGGVFHLLQKFVPETPKGKQPTNANDEWWAFICLGYRCDYEQWLGQAPQEVLEAWGKAPRL